MLECGAVLVRQHLLRDARDPEVGHEIGLGVIAGEAGRLLGIVTL
jgi:hypothetical protein